jgi:hypothetical protein
LLVKAVADHIDDTSKFEQSVLSSVLTVIFNPSMSGLGHGLVGRVSEWVEFPGAFWARRMQVGGLEVAAEDCVICGDTVGLVSACAAQGGLFFAIVNVLFRSDHLVGRCNVFIESDHSEAWVATELQQCIAWYRVAEGLVVLER